MCFTTPPPCSAASSDTRVHTEVLLLVGNVLKGQKIDPYNLTPAQQSAVKTALETNKVDTWLARKYRKTQADKEEVRGQ